MASKTLNCTKSGFHSGPTINSSGSFTVTRSEEQNKTVHISGSVTISVDSNSRYNTPPAFAEQKTNYAGLSVMIVSDQNNTERKPCQKMTTWDPSIGSSGANVSRDGKGWFNPRTKSDSAPKGGSFSVSYDQDLEWYTGELKVYVYCVWKVDGTCDQNHSAEIIGKLSLSDLPYNQYKTPTISISSGTSITKHNENRNVSIGENTSGDSSGTTVKVYVNGVERSTSIGNGSGTFTFKPSDNNVGHASSYKVKATRTHNNKTSLVATSNELTLYTYKLPTIESFSASAYTISGNAKNSPKLNWSCNNRRWSSLESQFKTYYSIDSGSNWKEIGNNNPTTDNADNTAQSYTITESFLNSNISNRNVDSANLKIRMRRKNESSGVVSDTSDITIKVNYKPTKSIPANSIFYYDCNSDNKTPNINKPLIAGNEYYVDEHPYVYVQWTYPSDIDGGVISGYEFRVYNNSSKSKQVYYTDITTSDLSKGVPLNIKTNLERGSINYVSIIPYYKDPNGTKRYGPEVLKQFIKPIGKLAKPVIEGPINGTRWHNNQFRILLKAPSDSDFDVLNIPYQDYRYKEIELDINNTIYKFSTYNYIFSTKDIHYCRPIVINPSLISNFINTNSYSIRIRFQKNYYSNIWSPWSDTITISNEPIYELNNSNGVEKGNIILASHYTYVRDNSLRLYDVYYSNRSRVPDTNIAKYSGDIIVTENYDGIYNTILQIQSLVNHYAIYDNDRYNVVFSKDINNLTGDKSPLKGEIITRDKISNIPIGRNYMNICIECMNKLSN